MSVIRRPWADFSGPQPVLGVILRQLGEEFTGSSPSSIIEKETAT
jgi:hypothetical protein